MTNSEEQVSSERGEETKPPRRRRRILKWSAVFALAVAVAAAGYLYDRHGRFYPSTSDAYIKANVVDIAPQVAGQVVAVPVSDQQLVKPGDLLFRIDPRPFRDKVAEARAALDTARQTVAAQQAAVEAAQAQISDRQATLKSAKQAYARSRDLVAQDVTTQARLDNTKAAFKAAQAELELARAQLVEAKAKLGRGGAGSNRIAQAKAVLDSARLDLSRTDVTAPCRGRLSGLSLRRGDIVHVGDQTAVLVCTSRFWVYANYKETDITRIRPGQSASIVVDMYPGHTFHGIVESIDPASGAAFSLLPPENATGNWVKVTQRVPVRILVTDAGDGYPLRVQTSAEVTIDTGTGTKPLGKPPGQTLSNAQAMQIAARDGTGP